MNSLSKSLADNVKKYSELSDDNRKKVLVELYTNMSMSWGQIGKLAGTYSNKVRRDAKKLGIVSRNKSAAQSAALNSGRHPHPTKDKGHTEDAKVKISKSVANIWDEMPSDERELRKEGARQRWSQKSEEEIRAFRQAAGDGVRKAAKEGSALEKFLLTSLIEHGYRVEFHKEQWVIRERLQMDLYIPELNVVIEVDGPSHFKDIWGKETLEKNQQRDAEKAGMFLERGLCIIRIRQKQAISKRYKRDILFNTLNALASIESKFPPKGQRHIILGD